MRCPSFGLGFGFTAREVKAELRMRQRRQAAQQSCQYGCEYSLEEALASEPAGCGMQSECHVGAYVKMLTNMMLGSLDPYMSACRQAAKHVQGKYFMPCKYSDKLEMIEIA